MIEDFLEEALQMNEMEKSAHVARLAQTSETSLKDLADLFQQPAKHLWSIALQAIRAIGYPQNSLEHAGISIHASAIPTGIYITEIATQEETRAYAQHLLRQFSSQDLARYQCVTSFTEVSAMPRKIAYRKTLLNAVEAFLEGSPTSVARAHRIVKRCNAALREEKKPATLNEMIWGFISQALTDSVFYESVQFLRETQQMLRGQAPRKSARTVLKEDYQVYFTTEEAQWYEELLRLLDFIEQQPYQAIYEATHQVWLEKATWPTLHRTFSEAVLAEQIDEEYWQHKAHLEEIAANNRVPEEAGEEQIYQVLLREVTGILTGIRVGQAAIAFGYPILDAPYSDYRTSRSSDFEGIDARDSLVWAKKALDALAGKREIFLTWRLSGAPSFDTNLLFVSLH